MLPSRNPGRIRHCHSSFNHHTFVILSIATFLQVIHLSDGTVGALSPDSSNGPSIFRQDIHMPGVTPTQHDEYLCTGKKLDSAEAYIVQYDVHSENNRAHHILLFGCTDVSPVHLKKGHWNCGNEDICEGSKIMFAWAKNAPPTKLPKDVGFRTGGTSGVNYLVLEIHYAHPLNESDSSGITLYTTYEQQKYIAGIFLLLASTTHIPPNQPKVHTDIDCLYEYHNAIHPFAYRVHAHSLGVVISGYKYNPNTRQWTLLGKGNPQWPQAFYPMDEVHTVQNGDYLVARCTYNSTGRDRWTSIGSTAADEMCNFYIMYYTSAEKGSSFYQCYQDENQAISNAMPADSDVPLPRNALLEEHAHGVGSHMGKQMQNNVPAQSMNMNINKKGHSHRVHPPSLDDYYNPEYSYDEEKTSNEQVQHGIPLSTQQQTSQRLPEDLPHRDMYEDVLDWPTATKKFGQVTALTLDSQGNVVVFHRADRIWNIRSFDLYDRFMQVSDGPIAENTIVVFNTTTGNVMNEWGKNFFYMPHGLTIDKEGNVWVTDVALHQVLKFPPGGSATPLLTLGVRLEPGKDDDHFCKPSSVAVTSTGDFFVADGYCNNRILKYSGDGKLVLQFGKKTVTILGFKLGVPPPYAFSVPHKLALAEDKDLVCVADRENGRIQCFSIANGTFHCQLHRPEFGDKLFAVAYSPVQGGLLFAVNGPMPFNNTENVQGFVFNISTQKLMGTIRPTRNQVKTFQNPHDITVSPDGSCVYISEIGPNKVWKFVSKKTVETTTIIPKNVGEEHQQRLSVDTAVEENKAVKDENVKVVKLWSGDNFAPTVIIMAMLAIPVLLVILVTVFIRLKKQGHVKGWLSGYKQPNNNDRFNLGNFLHSHKGFDRVRMEESDVESTDSDVEEYSASVQKA